jgi:hypothetical protein
VVGRASILSCLSLTAYIPDVSFASDSRGLVTDMRCATRYTGFLAGCFACLLVGCASAPIQQMSDARQALQAAEQAGAPELAPIEFKQANRHLTKAEHAMEVAEYRRARAEAEQAQGQATDARSLAVALQAAHDAVQQGKAIGAPSPDAGLFLDRALQAAKLGQTKRAHALATQARDVATAAAGKWYAGEAWSLIERLEASAARLEPGQRARLDKAKEAYERGDGKAAYDLLKPLADAP